MFVTSISWNMQVTCFNFKTNALTEEHAKARIHWAAPSRNFCIASRSLWWDQFTVATLKTHSIPAASSPAGQARLWGSFETVPSNAPFENPQWLLHNTLIKWLVATTCSWSVHLARLARHTQSGPHQNNDSTRPMPSSWAAYPQGQICLNLWLLLLVFVIL